MKFLSTRELRNRPGRVRELTQEDDLVLTANGRPVAMVVGVAEEDVEETAQLLRQVRAQRALARMRRGAARRGVADMPAAEIQEQVRRARSKRKSA